MHGFLVNGFAYANVSVAQAAGLRIENDAAPVPLLTSMLVESAKVG